MIYFITVSRSITVLSSVSTPARAWPWPAGGALAWEHMILDRNTLSTEETARGDSYVQMRDGSHAICGPRFAIPSVSLSLYGSGAELTPVSVNLGMPSARTHPPPPPHCALATAGSALQCHTVCGQ